MTKTQLTAILGFLMMAASCTKEQRAKDPNDFMVSAEAHSYKAGDTVSFTLAGKPDMILFYSGEPGKRYEHRARLAAAGTEKLVFQTSMQQGVLPGTDSMQLLISTNLKGYDSASIVNATWTDITDRNKKWPSGLTTGYTTSDSINLSDFNQADSINIAFRALGKKTATAQRKWQMQNLTLYNNLPDGTSTPLFSSFANPAWVQCSLKNPAGVWNVGTWNVSNANAVNNSAGVPIRTAYPVTFDPGTATNTEENDDWLIATAIDLKRTKPDAGTIIKNRVNTSMSSYKYIFKTAGTYTVTFEGMNVTDSETKGVVRQVQVTVLP